MNSTSAIRIGLVIRSGLRHQDTLSCNTPALSYSLPQGPFFFQFSELGRESLHKTVGTELGKGDASSAGEWKTKAS